MANLNWLIQSVTIKEIIETVMLAVAGIVILIMIGILLSNKISSYRKKKKRR